MCNRTRSHTLVTNNASIVSVPKHMSVPDDNVSTDSQIEFVIMEHEHNNDIESNDGDATAGSEVVATDHADGGGDSVTRNSTATAVSPTPSSGTVTGGADTTTHGAGAAPAAQACVPIGIAPGDGDLMPPRFTDDRNTDADDWLQDFLDYVNIRQVPKATATILLRNRLTGAARKWFEALPSDIDFDETIRRFRKRFAASAGRRDELLDGFWNRRQGPEEPASTYIETMVSMARRVHLDNEPLMRHAIIQRLRPDIRRDVRVLRPSTLEELAEAAAIGESNARLMTTEPRSTDAAVSAQLAEMRSMVAALTEIVTTQQRPGTSAGIVDAPAQRTALPATTTAATAVHVQQDVVATATAPATSAADPRGMTVQLVMPPSVAPQYGVNHGALGGRPARGRGRGYRGPWRGRGPTQPLNAAAAPFRGSGGAGTAAPSGADATPTCVCCGRRHADTDCTARDAICYSCGICGHFARCCQYRLNAQTHH